MKRLQAVIPFALTVVLLATLLFVSAGAWQVERAEADNDRPPSSEPVGGDAALQSAQIAAAAPALAGTYKFRASSAVFRPRSTKVQFDYISPNNLRATAGDSWEVFVAPVVLPQGVTVRSVRMYYNDTSTSDCSGWFSVYGEDGHLVAEYWVHSTGSSGDGYADLTGINYVVDNQHYSYVFNWRPYDLNTIALRSMEVGYDSPVFLPSVIR